MEHANDVARADIKETAFEGLKDLLTTTVETEVKVLLNVQLLVGMGHGYFTAIRNEWNAFHHSIVVYSCLQRKNMSLGEILVYLSDCY